MRCVFLSAQHPNVSYRDCMTEVNGSDVTFLNSTSIASNPEMSPPEARPRLQQSHPLSARRAGQLFLPSRAGLLWLAPDRPGFSLKPVFSAVKHRNLLPLRELQTSLTRHHSNGSKRAEKSQHLLNVVLWLQSLWGLLSSLPMVSPPVTHLRRLY